MKIKRKPPTHAKGGPAVTDDVALVKVRLYLSGLPGYNPMPEAQSLLARAVQAVALSVEHADFALSQFEDRCPSPREIKDTLLSSKARFEPEERLKEKWLAEGATYDPVWSSNFITSALVREQLDECHLQAIRDVLYYTEGPGQHELDNIHGKQARNDSRGFWQDARRRDLENYPELVAWIRGGEVGPMPAIPSPLAKLRKSARAETSTTAPLPTPPPITEADVEEAKRKWEEQKARAREASESPDFEEFDDGYREPDED